MAVGGVESFESEGPPSCSAHGHFCPMRKPWASRSSSGERLLGQLDREIRHTIRFSGTLASRNLGTMVFPIAIGTHSQGFVGFWEKESSLGFETHVAIVYKRPLH
jgi:hypothetical protein